MTNGTRCLGTVASVVFVLSAGCGSTIIEPPPPLPAPVRVAPSTLRLDLRESIQLQVTVAKALAGAPVTWSSSNPLAAEVTATGMVTATGVGFAVITATVGSDAGRAVVTVGQAPCRIILRC